MKQKLLVPAAALFSAVLVSASEPGFLLDHGYSQNSLKQRSVSSPLPFPYRYVGREALTDTVKIIALRIEFKSDNDINTTGNGRFGIWNREIDTVHSYNDEKELNWYKTGGYKYDLLPHDSLYFSQKLDFLRDYYKKVSKGKLVVDYEIFPRGAGQNSAYQVSRKMALYSPGTKGGSETYTAYANRRSRLFMEFVNDALLSASSNPSESPFSRIVTDSADGTLWEVDSLGRKVHKAAVLIIHAGASNLTNGAGGNSPSDLTDNFTSNQLFEYYTHPDRNVFKALADTIAGKPGMQFTGWNGKKGVISEVMMIPETSNQDSVNYGTHGILVNQFARQLGIPDLYSTSEGVTGIGRLDIMDFEGYSTANGFIPPNPSAWTRLFMGWDQPKAVVPGSSISLKAVGTSDSGTMAIVPINSHEYWLIENRQRNLTGDTALFNYDTVDGETYIQNLSSVNLQKAADSVSSRSVIMRAKSQDIGITGSGIAVWHIDESLISNRIAFNLVNTDPKLRGVALEEADGVNDIGVSYSSITGTTFGNGTADDFFPHRIVSRKNSYRDFRNEMSPITSPSTAANDGGNTFLELVFDSTASALREKYRIGRSGKQGNNFADFYVYNYADSALTFSVKQNQTYSVHTQMQPVRVSSVSPYDLLAADLAGSGALQIITLDSLGHFSVLSETGAVLPDSSRWYTVTPQSKAAVDTIYYSDSIADVYTMPTLCGSAVYVPSRSGIITRFTAVSALSGIVKQEIAAGVPLTSPIISLGGTEWSVGGKNGQLLFGSSDSLLSAVALGDSGSVQALTFNGTVLTAVTGSGMVFTISAKKVTSSVSLKSIVNTPVYAPFSAVSGDLDGDGIIEIAVTDSKQGLFLLQYNPQKGTLSPHTQSAFSPFPNDWAGYFHEGKGRDKIPSNGAQPSLTDIDGDGTLEILVPGTNGIYAFSSRGIMMPGWPILLDKSNWRMRRSSSASPVSFTDPSGKALMLYSTPTGNNLTYEVSKITKTGPDKSKKGKFTAYFSTSDGTPDSLTNLDSLALFDTMLVQNDSLVLPYVMPGGLIDAGTGAGVRPDTVIVTSEVGKRSFSPWPLTLGTPVFTAPVLISSGDRTVLCAVSDNGYLYRWNIGAVTDVKPVWSMAGGNAGRTFSLNSTGPNSEGSSVVNNFYSYPNPLRIIDNSARLTFRYELGTKAVSVNLSMYTADGRLIFDQAVPSERGINEYTLPDLSLLGSAPYTCRLEVKFPSSTDIKFWKTAVLRGSK